MVDAVNSRAGSPELNTHPPMYTDEEPIRQKVVKRIDEEITSVQSKPNVVSLEPVTTEVVTDIHLNVTTIQPTSNVDSVEQEPTTMAELVDRNVTTVQPKTDAAVMTHWSVVNVTCNCSQPAEVKNGKFDVTYVTQTSYILHLYVNRSLNRFVLFAKEILSRWNGFESSLVVIHRPLVISVCIRSEDELSQLQSFLEEAEFPPHFVVIPYLDTSDHYPINKLRNIAIEQVATSHYLMTDIDLFPAGGAEWSHQRQAISTRRFCAFRTRSWTLRNRRSSCPRTRCVSTATGSRS